MLVGVDLMDELRRACAGVAKASRHVHIERHAIGEYAATLPLDAPSSAPDPEVHLVEGSREELVAFWLTLDAINFGSGWFPTLRKLPGRSGYFTVAVGVRDRFVSEGPWSPEELEQLPAGEIAAWVGQRRDDQLMQLFATSLNDLGARIGREFDGRFSYLLDWSGGSAIKLVERLAGWDCFADVSHYDQIQVPFLKRAQLAAADLASAGVAEFYDLDRLTMFADNLVPHVLRLDQVLNFEPPLVDRIERGELIEHGSREEVEIRASAVHAVELIVAAQPGTRASLVDQVLWRRGQDARYKSCPRHRCRCTAY